MLPQINSFNFFFLRNHILILGIIKVNFYFLTSFAMFDVIVVASKLDHLAVMLFFFIFFLRKKE